MATVLMGFSSLAHLSGHRSVSNVIIQAVCTLFPWVISYFLHFIDVGDSIVIFFGTFYFPERGLFVFRLAGAAIDK